MLRSGLAVPGKDGRPRDMFRDRLMIPVRRPGDRVVIAFVGRRHPDAGDEHGPKYLNSPNTDLYVKSHVLPGLAEGQRFLDQGAQPVIVEGVTDAWAVSIAAPGRYVGLPLCGTALSGEQVAALARAVDLPERGVRIALDPDSAGHKAAIRAYASLSAVGSGDLTAVLLPSGRDPAELLRTMARQRCGTPSRQAPARWPRSSSTPASATGRTTGNSAPRAAARSAPSRMPGHRHDASDRMPAPRHCASARCSPPPMTGPKTWSNRELIAAVEHHFQRPGQQSSRSTQDFLRPRLR